MNREELISSLQYIADSPSIDHGGFHHSTIETAQAALEILNQPWLDKPDSEGWWWFRNPDFMNFIYPMQVNQLTDGSLRFQHFLFGALRKNSNYLKGGKWQKAIVSEPPKEE